MKFSELPWADRGYRWHPHYKNDSNMGCWQKPIWEGQKRLYFLTFELWNFNREFARAPDQEILYLEIRARSNRIPGTDSFSMKVTLHRPEHVDIEAMELMAKDMYEKWGGVPYDDRD